MAAKDLTHVSVFLPVPGYYLAAAAAGMVSGNTPEQGFTNVPISGNISKLKYAGDFFSEANLNTVASGGNYIMWQSSLSAPVSSRHQMSTNVSGVELQELSITKSIDYTAKFVRSALVPYIGRYNITEAFLSMVRTILNGQATFLRREGHVSDLKVLKVEQDDVAKDRVLVELNILVLYPVNYIKIQLQF